ncbi:cystathionine gamma-synthase [Corynebacterium sp. 153RC1]|uniref:cystathionine gamma-synthase n=1 Tax=unclassified Corynebacterium TaxID=2624378 RepID=UPI00211D06C1|nr:MULTISPECIES: cystathionine gamma-synthase [unclassified Corynebacterium]MCQ9371086.1 cystathionine gamma-synthase [Corynebacterium sp. 35RC1]MCQ9353024.1 cystathionine gamma-synthase [Corynebacterium sp. 209RC1]MCQ9355482.1 cystathionine gamma-synthase [Corynebacterium sp. 1222RC1]MCQ9357143.1 cystathionine gamma-synthase [Corynebacterium sp. 122RC1]MCQ9359713.1 cystathionine gamma-synthase [Corynebacterium sp. 142RC1]
MSAAKDQGFSTASIHAGYEPDSLYGSINTPIYASTTFAQNGLNELRGGYEYTRCGNPTITALEKTVAALEGAEFGRAFSSGMAATDVLLRIFLRPGSHLVFGHDAYGGTFRLIDQVFTQWGVEYTVVDTTDAQAVGQAVQENTALVWLETPSNPGLSITDIQAVADAVAGRAPLVVDNTFASPYLQNPLKLGAAAVLHSTTKYIGGHSDVVGGLVVTNDAKLDEDLLFYQGGTGAIPSVFDAYLTARGLKTLAVRMDRHCDNAEAIAKHLNASEKVATVLYPGLETHPGHEVAARQMRRFGAMISVRFHSEEAARAFCLNTKVIALAESLGGVESLVEHPASMTHQSVTDSVLEVPRDLVRISVGIEDIEDLIADVDAALAAIN